MINERNASSSLMSDIVYMAQRASAETCEVSARTIARQALKFLKVYPQNVTNKPAFQDATRELCECLLMLRSKFANPGEEILIKRDALDLLLMISRQLRYPDLQEQEEILAPELDTVEFA